MAAPNDSTVLEEKVKYLESIRSLAKGAVDDYDDLFLEYTEVKNSYDDLLKEHKEQQAQMEQVVHVLQSVSNDFAAMESKVQVSTFLQTEVEKFANKLYVENKKIKRQSQRLMEALGEASIVNINFDEPEITTSADEQTQVSSDVISKMQDTIASLEVKLNNTEIEHVGALRKIEEYKILLKSSQEKQKESRHSIVVYESIKDNFESVSQMALERINVLENDLKCERFLKDKAVETASELHRKHKVLKRQSLAVVNAANSQESLNKALIQIEQLTNELEEQKLIYIQQIKDLSSESEKRTIEDLQRTIAKLEAENERVSAQNEKLLHNLENIRYDNRVMHEQLDIAKKVPPPPPPPPVRTLNPIKWIIGKSQTDPKTQKIVKRPDGHENFDKALEELMSRIKNKSTAAQSPDLQNLLEKDDHKTSKQLNDFIGNLKKSNFRSKIEIADEPEPEFVKIQRKMSSSRDATKEDQEPRDDDGNAEVDDDEVIIAL